MVDSPAMDRAMTLVILSNHQMPIVDIACEKLPGSVASRVHVSMAYRRTDSTDDLYRCIFAGLDRHQLHQILCSLFITAAVRDMP